MQCGDGNQQLATMADCRDAEFLDPTFTVRLRNSLNLRGKIKS
jgi:hypothetical protein